jgi:hypothetical protein
MRVPVPLVQDREAATTVLRAIAHGMIDTYVPAPSAGRDAGFHRAVSELLEEAAQDTGDVRHGSVKRVASAVGEGSIATTQISQYLQSQAGHS